MEFAKLFRLGVYLQPILWMFLYDSHLNLERHRKPIILGAIVFMVGVYVTGFSVAFYTTHLLILYSLMVLGTLLYLERAMAFSKALPLSFLLVFFNSYFWELPLHIIAGIIDPQINQLEQALHLIPLPFLIVKLRPEKSRENLRKVCYAMASTLLIMLLRIWFLSGWLSLLAMDLNRIICLVLLVKIFYDSSV